MPSLGLAQQWKIGILAQRGSIHTHLRWQPWINWLNQHFSPNHQFVLVTLGLDDLEKSQAQGIDFILANQAQFLYLNKTDVRWLASLKSLSLYTNASLNQIGSAIFVRQDSPYYQLTDLKYQTVSAVSPKALGGFLLGYNEFYKQDISESEIKLSFTGFPVEAPLLLLHENKTNAAIVPSCILEELVQEKILNIKDFRLLSPKPNNAGCQTSTQLVPNWSLAALPQVPADIASQLITLLLSNTPDHLPQWTAPYSTSQTDALLYQLHKHPMQDFWQNIKFWFQQYQHWIIGITLLLSGNFLWINLQIHRKSKALHQAHQAIRKYEQQLIQADRLSLLGEMNMGIAHEMNQPLTAIQMYAEGIKYQLQQTDTDAVTKNLNKILGQVERCANIIHNLMAWGKNKSNEKLEEVQLKALLERSIQFISLSHSPLHRIVLICPENITLHIPPTLLEQVICNCLLNAIQAESSEIYIEVIQNTAHLNITINDNGIGFSENDLTFPFVPFRTSKPDGLGLGLVLCQRLIRSLNGEIRLTNRENQQGARIILTLPYSREKYKNEYTPCR